MYEIAELDVPNHDDFKNQIAALHDAAFAWAVRCSNGDWHEGEEVLQSVYLKVVEGRAVFRKESALKTWLFGVIRNTARERARKRQRQRFLLFQWSANEQNTSVDNTPDDARQEQLGVALASLSKRQREVLELVFYHEMTVEQAATVMEISVGSARTHYHRGKLAIAKHLEMQEQV